jgi:hypothetical protein
MQNYTKYGYPARKRAFFLLFLREILCVWGKSNTFAPLFQKHAIRVMAN